MEENVVNNNLYEPSADNKNKKTKLGIIINIILTILAVIALCIFIFGLIFDGVYVVGPSMMPNFIGAKDENSSGGDYVYINKFATPERGDVVVLFTDVNGDRKAIIKRVIGLEGDSLYLENGKLYVKYANGSGEFELIEEDYINDEYNNPYLSHNSTEVITVPENGVYVLGDNRNVSQDSRYEGYGCFDLQNVAGVVTDWSITYKEQISSLYNAWNF